VTQPQEFVLSLEQRALFNPAFISVLAHGAAVGFADKAGRSMPLPFFYVSLTMSLRQDSRRALPQRTTTFMSSWLRANPQALSDLHSVVSEMRDVISAGVRYGVHHQVLTSQGGGLAAQAIRRRPRSLQATDDWSECLKAASFMGRWLGIQQTDTASTLALWGLRP
jgi:hypothetical protein